MRPRPLTPARSARVMWSSSSHSTPPRQAGWYAASVASSRAGSNSASFFAIVVSEDTSGYVGRTELWSAGLTSRLLALFDSQRLYRIGSARAQRRDQRAG